MQPRLQREQGRETHTTRQLSIEDILIFADFAHGAEISFSAGHANHNSVFKEHAGILIY